MTQRRSASQLLISEPPLLVLPSLAVAVGLNEAIFLQQLHYWLLKSDKVRDGRTWVYNTYEEWHMQLPFWSVRTIRRIVGALEDQGVVVSTTKYNQQRVDQTKWYAIDYARLDGLTEGADQVAKLATSTDGVVSLATWSGQAGHEQVAEVAASVPETTQETTPERTGQAAEFVPGPDDPGRVAAAVAQVAAELRDEAHPDHTTRRAWEGYVAAGVGFEAWLGAVDYARRMALRTWTNGAESRMPAFWRALEGRLGERERRTA